MRKHMLHSAYLRGYDSESTIRDRNNFQVILFLLSSIDRFTTRLRSVTVSHLGINLRIHNLITSSRVNIAPEIWWNLRIPLGAFLVHISLYDSRRDVHANSHSCQTRSILIGSPLEPSSRHE